MTHPRYTFTEETGLDEVGSRRIGIALCVLSAVFTAFIVGWLL